MGGDFPARAGLPERARYPDRWAVARPAPTPPPVGRHILAAERQELLDLLDLGMFALLDDEFAELRANLARDIRWEDQLVDSYMAFGGPRAEIFDRLDEWVRASGAWSATPWVARAWFWWARAEEWDRERSRPGDSAEADANADEAIRAGRSDARRALELDPGDMGAHVALLRLDGIYLMGNRSLDIVEAALARFPASHRVRWEALWRVRPIKGGSYELMQALIDEAQTRLDANPRLSGLAGWVALDEAARLRDRGDLAGALRKLDEAEARGATGWLHHMRALTWMAGADPARALAEANLAVAAEPAAWQVLDVRARILSWIAGFSLGQAEDLLAQALADQDDALALQPLSFRGLEQRQRIAAFHADCAHSVFRCFAHTDTGTGEPSEVTDPESWWLRVIMFVLGIPLTLLLVLIEGERYYLLPLPLAALWAIGWNWVEWRRHTYWVPRTVHVMAVLAFLMIVGINVAWVRAGGTMWTQRYVVIVVCVLVPYLVYLTLGGPRWMSYRGHVPAHRRRPAKGGGGARGGSVASGEDPGAASGVSQ